MRNRLTPCPLAWFVVLITLGASLAGAQQLQRGPVNPEYIDYQDALLAGRWRTTLPDGRGLGHIPALIDTRYVLRTDRVMDLPATYDLRDTAGKVPAVTNQNPCGTCWIFATYGSLETCIRPGDTIDCSENHLKNTNGFTIPGGYTCCTRGGNATMTTAYLARWSGPIADADDPYNTGSCTSSGGLTTQRHLTEMRYLPVRTGPTDNATIKQAVVDYGGIYVSMQWSDTYYNSAHAAYYRNGGLSDGGHAVTLIGWNDSYATSNFNTAPPGAGAFLARNSWGSGWGSSGYFWISYYDNVVGYSTVAQFVSANASNDVPTIYSVDELGPVYTLGYGDPYHYAWVANRCTKGTGQQNVKYVGFWTLEPNMTYDVEVWRDPTGGPRTGTRLYQSTGNTATYAGYRVVGVDLANGGVAVPSGTTTFDIALKLTTAVSSTSHSPAPVEAYYTDYSQGFSCSGTSYISLSGTSFSSLSPDYDACLKAFTYPGVLNVRVAGLEAKAGRNQVRVTWETASEVGMLGFHVLRAEGPDGPFVRVNRKMIPATAQPGRAGRYEFVDRTARPGRAYYYRLAQVSDGGEVTEQPETAEAATRESRLYDLLPPGLRDLVSS